MTEVSAGILARNSTFALVAQIWRVGSRFVLTPIIITKIGLDGYGIWTLLFSICAYVGVIDVNFGLAYKKLTAEYDAKRDYVGLTHILSSGMTLVGSVAVLALSIVWWLHVPILRVLGVPGEHLYEAAFALLLIMASLLLRMSAGCVFPVLAGLQRLDLYQILGMVASGVDFVVSLVFLLRGWGLLGLAIGHVAGQVLTTCMAWRYCARLCPELRVSPFRCSRLGFRAVVGLGARFQFIAILHILIHNGTRVLISALLGVSMLAINEIATKVIMLGVSVAGAVTAPLMPAFANLHGRGMQDRARRLYDRSSKILMIVCAISFSFLAMFADQIIEAWTGRSYPLSAWTVRWIAPVAVLGMLASPAAAVLRAHGKVKLEMFYAILSAAILVVLYPVGYYTYGYKGMIGAEVLAGTVSAMWFLAAFTRAEGYALARFLSEVVFRPVVVFAPAVILTAVLSSQLDLSLAIHSKRMSEMIDVCVWGVLFSIATGISGWFGVLSPSERGKLARFVPYRSHPFVRRMLRFSTD